MAENILDKMKGANPTRLIVYLFILALVAAALVSLAMWRQRPEYRTLFGGLADEDMSAVVENLEARKVPYKIIGGAVKVPGNQLYETRIALAGDGLPQGGSVGFEIFDESSFGITQFVQKINYMRAMQGELARTITQIQVVEGARVHLSVPEKGVFLDDIEKGRASVVLKLKGSGGLTPSQVQAIVHLTASSVEGLLPADVTVVDTTGRMWTDASDESAVPMGLTSAQFEYKRRIEKDMERRIQTMLEKTIGAGKVVARVSTEMITVHRERTEETYDPDGQVVRSEHRTKEKTIGGVSASGVPGVLSNVPGGGGGAGSGATPSQSQKQDEVINYEISKVISRVIEPVGEIEKLSISVFVDGNYEEIIGKLPEDAEEDAVPPVTKKYIERSSDELQKLEVVVRGIIGFDEARGDTITIESVPFESSAMPTLVGDMVESGSMLPAFLTPYINTIIKSGVSGVIALFVILFILKPVIKRLTEETKALSTIGEIGVGGGGVTATEGTPEYELQMAESKNETERIKDAVRQNPRQAAMILKGWIQDNK